MPPTNRDVTLRSTYDAEHDVGYLYLSDPGIESEEQVEVETPSGAELVLDFDKNGKLIGIEFLPAKELMPDSLR